MADDEGHYFHWELNIPVAFYDNDGDEERGQWIRRGYWKSAIHAIQTIRQADESLPKEETEFNLRIGSIFMRYLLKTGTLC